MNRKIHLLSLVLSLVLCEGSIYALDCPRMPEQSKKDWEIEINAAVLKIGPVRGMELKSRTRNTTKDLLGKLPQAESIYLEQMMYSSYCSALRDDTTIKELDKAKMLREYNKEVRKAITTSTYRGKRAESKASKGGITNKPLPQKSSETILNKEGLKSNFLETSKKSKSLIDFYLTDFATLFRATNDTVVSSDGDQVNVKSQAYLDFDSQSIFLGFYIPNTPHTYTISVFLANYYKTVLDQMKKTLMIESSQPGLQTVNSSELRFTGRVFLYHESLLLEGQKRELFSLYKSQGVSLQFRDWKYVHEMNKE